MKMQPDMMNKLNLLALLVFFISNKAYFYAQKNNKTMLKKYVVKNDFVYVEKIEGGWAYCSFYGNKITNGWIKLENLNK